MSLNTLSWAWEQELPPTQKLILISLADHANQDGECWSSIKRLAKFTGLSRAAVKNNIRKLEETGLVKREARTRENSKHNTSNKYFLVKDRGQEVTHIGQEVTQGVGQEVTQGGSGGDPGGGSGGDPQEHSNIEPPNNPTPTNGNFFETIDSQIENSPTIEQQFDEWWKGVPKKVGKDDAFKAFKSVLPKTNLEELDAARDRWAEERAGKDPTFTKSPAAWLRGGYWRPPEDAPTMGRSRI